MRNGNIKANSENIRKDKNVNNVNNIKEKSIIKLLVWIIIAVFMIFQVIQLINYTLGNIEKEDAFLYNLVDKVVSTVLPKLNVVTEENYSLNLATLGDIYVTQNVLNGSKTSSSYDFVTGTEDVQKQLQKFDIVLASLSTPVSNKGTYTSGSKYTAPEEILELLKKLNISTVATASYHAFDKSKSGISSTISLLKENNINQVGISNNESGNKPVIINKNNISIGVLSYTTSSNEKLGKNEDYLLNIINEEKVKEDINYLNNNKVDFIIAYLNVKNENVELPNANQKSYTEMLFNSGVNVVIGTGSRVIQETQEDLIEINNKSHHVYVAYSLGDFIGSYEKEENRENLIANFEFSKKVVKNKKDEVIEEVKDMKVNEPIKIEVDVSKSYATTMSIVK